MTKALHAQELGAKMVIIMDNEEHDRRIIMKDNGYGITEIMQVTKSQSLVFLLTSRWAKNLNLY